MKRFILILLSLPGCASYELPPGGATYGAHYSACAAVIGFDAEAVCRGR